MQKTGFRFSLDTGSKKWPCPSCRQKTFVRYVDTVTRELLGNEVGRCDRENRCGYHNPPKMNNRPLIDTRFSAPVEPVAPLNFIDPAIVSKSLDSALESYFSRYMARLFGDRYGAELLNRYQVGRSRVDNGRACIFWRIDIDGRVRTGKIMAYDAETGKRSRIINPTWVHTTLKPFNYLQCFFGEHLLAGNNRPVAICESEKTAIISSFFLPQFTWLATGGSHGCKWREYAVFKSLKGRKVTLFPDHGMAGKRTCYQDWNERAVEIMNRMDCEIRVSRVLEDAVPEGQRPAGLDLADLLVRQDERTGLALIEPGYPATWDYH